MLPHNIELLVDGNQQQLLSRLYSAMCLQSYKMLLIPQSSQTIHNPLHAVSTDLGQSVKA